jgi:uroporphyrinogen III methyltransferase / synthase
VSARVLITRDPVRAGMLVERLRSSGVDAVAEPVTRTVFTDDAVSLPALDGFRWLAFTSANAVTAFADALRLNEKSLPEAMRIAAVGAATAAEILRRLHSPDVVASDSNGAELADTLLHVDHEIRGASLLWPCGARASAEFANRLTGSGVNVTPWECYSTEPVDPKVIAQNLTGHAPADVVLFAAPSAVKAFHAAMPTPWDFECVAIGTTTAAALLKAGADRLIVCASTALQDQQNAVIEAISRHQNRINKKAGTL